MWIVKRSLSALRVNFNLPGQALRRVVCGDCAEGMKDGREVVYGDRFFVGVVRMVDKICQQEFYNLIKLIINV